MGICRVPVGTKVTLTMWDHGQVDGDRVALKWNGNALDGNLRLPGPPGVNRSVMVDDVDNFLDITAINEGSISPNTDMIRVSPCRDGKAQNFEWKMKRNEVRTLSIEGL